MVDAKYLYHIRISLLALFFLIGSFRLAHADDICIIRGLNFPIYQEVISGFWKQFKQSPSKCDAVLKGKEDQVKDLITKNKPNLILALGSSAINFAKKNFPSTPLVYGMSTETKVDERSAGVVAEVAFNEQISLVKKSLPGLKRVGLIYSVANRNMAMQFKSNAESQGLTVNAHAINSPDEASGVVANLKGDELLWLLPDQGVVTAQNRSELFRVASENGLKIYAFSPTYLKGADGADLSVSLDWETYGGQIAVLAAKVLASPQKQFPTESPQEARIYFKKGRKGFNMNIQGAEFIP